MKININYRCFVVVGVRALCGIVFMIEVVLLWWIEIPCCYGGVCDGPILVLFLSSWCY